MAFFSTYSELDSEMLIIKSQGFGNTHGEIKGKGGRRVGDANETA